MTMEMSVGNTDRFHLLAPPQARHYCKPVTRIHTCNPHHLTHWVMILTAMILDDYYPYFTGEEAKTQKSDLTQTHMDSEWQNLDPTLGSRTRQYFN